MEVVLSGIMIFVKLLQAANAYSPMEVTLLPMTTSVKLLQSEKVA